MTQFRKRSAGPLDPAGYLAAADKLRRLAERLEQRAQAEHSTITRVVTEIEHYARALARRHRETAPAPRALRVTIPEDIDYADLRLTRDPVSGEVELDWSTIERICEASGIDVAVFQDAPDENVGALLIAWYEKHRAQGGAPDLVYEQILAEIEAEAVLGARRVHIAPATVQ